MRGDSIDWFSWPTAVVMSDANTAHALLMRYHALAFVSSLRDTDLSQGRGRLCTFGGSSLSTSRDSSMAPQRALFDTIPAVRPAPTPLAFAAQARNTVLSQSAGAGAFCQGARLAGSASSTWSEGRDEGEGKGWGRLVGLVGSPRSHRPVCWPRALRRARRPSRRPPRHPFSASSWRRPAGQQLTHESGAANRARVQHVMVKHGEADGACVPQFQRRLGQEAACLA